MAAEDDLWRAGTEDATDPEPDSDGVRLVSGVENSNQKGKSHGWGQIQGLYVQLVGENVH